MQSNGKLLNVTPTAAAVLRSKEAARQPSPEELDAYMHLNKEEIARLVLCLLIEEAVKNRLASFLSQNLPA